MRVMALAGHIIQANVNHSASAQDLLLQAMAEHGTGLAVIAEPYRIPQLNCCGDSTGMAAIIRAGKNDSPAITTITKGQGYVIVQWGEMYIAGLYASPNAPLSSLQAMLDDMRNKIAPLMSEDLIICGDFNAKSTLWGSPRTNPRGEAVTEWAAELDLQLLNDGRENTCVRWQGESKVDLTWASPSAAHKIKLWRVATEMETLSDHRYIFIEMEPRGGDGQCKRQTKQQGQGKEKRLEDRHHPRWAVKRLNEDRLKIAAQAAAWLQNCPRETEAESPPLLQKVWIRNC